jgi:hypothetical protein
MEFDSGFGKREIPNRVKAFFNDGTNKTIISKKNNLFDVSCSQREETRRFMQDFLLS